MVPAFLYLLCVNNMDIKQKVILNVNSAKKGRVGSWYRIVRNGFLEILTFRKKTEGLNYRSYVVENQIERVAHVNDLW